MATTSNTPVKAKTKRQQLDDTAAAMRHARSSFDAHWRELAELFLPRRTQFQTSDRNRGDKRHQQLYNNTPMFAARTLASGMHAGLTSPARPWMKLSVPDPALAEFPAVKQWLHTVTTRMLTLFQRSNLYNVLPTTYHDMGVFATAAQSLMPDPKTIFRFYSYPIGSYAFSVDGRGQPTAFYRDYRMTVRQVVEEFATLPSRGIDRSRLSQTVLQAWDTGNYEQEVEVRWIVTPNTDYDYNKPWARNMRFSSCYYETGSQTSDTRPDVFLRESGFKTFPVMCPRWDAITGDIYGTSCPGMIALGDDKSLQTMEKRKLQAVEKMVNPPVVGPESLRTQKTSLLPGEITYNDEREGMKGLRPVHEVKPDVSALSEDMARYEYRIERAFYADLFLMLSQMRNQQPVTAREIDERHEEKLLALGPVLERTDDELLNPTIDRAFQFMVDNNLVPTIPRELSGMELSVEFTSLMAQAQKLVGVVGLDRFMQSVGAMVQVFPDVMHKVNAMQAVDEYANALGVNPSLVVSDEDAQAAKDAQQQAAQQALAAESMNKLATGAAALGNTPSLSMPSALSDVLGPVAGVV